MCCSVRAEKLWLCFVHIMPFGLSPKERGSPPPLGFLFFFEGREGGMEAVGRALSRNCSMKGNYSFEFQRMFVVNLLIWISKLSCFCLMFALYSSLPRLTKSPRRRFVTLSSARAEAILVLLRYKRCWSLPQMIRPCFRDVSARQYRRLRIRTPMQMALLWQVTVTTSLEATHRPVELRVLRQKARAARRIRVPLTATIYWRGNQHSDGGNSIMTHPGIGWWDVALLPTPRVSLEFRGARSRSGYELIRATIPTWYVTSVSVLWLEDFHVASWLLLRIYYIIFIHFVQERKWSRFSLWSTKSPDVWYHSRPCCLFAPEKLLLSSYRALRLRDRWYVFQNGTFDTFVLGMLDIFVLGRGGTASYKLKFRTQMTCLKWIHNCFEFITHHIFSVWLSVYNAVTNIWVSYNFFIAQSIILRTLP